MSANRKVSLARRLAAEAGGTAFLLAAVAGSATMAERLAEGNAAVALVASSMAIGTALVALTLAFGSISGAHFNPALTLAAALRRELTAREAVAYAAVQIAGAVVGVGLAGFLFGDPLAMPAGLGLTSLQSRRVELFAAFGLVAIVASCRHSRPDSLPYAVSGYLVAVMWATGSTSLANPAVTLAAATTTLPALIEWGRIGSTLIGELGGTLAAVFVTVWLLGRNGEAPASSASVAHLPAPGEHSRSVAEHAAQSFAEAARSRSSM